jgi:NCS2 family nucleobase:cation symporter-2/xanthine permease XanP
MYGPDDRVPAGAFIFVGLQQVAAMVVGVITPALLLSELLHFTAPDTAYLVSMALICAAVGTLIQTTPIGPLGSGLLSITGTSFAFIQPLIMAGKAGGLPLMFGMALAAVPAQMVLAPFLPKLRGMLTPLISGIVVVLIGLSIIPSAMNGIVAPVGAGAPIWAGAGVAAVVIATVLFATALGRPWGRMIGILLGVAAGYLVCAVCGWLHAPPASSEWISVPRFVPFGLAFRAEFLLPFMFIYIVSVLEAMGDMTATSQLSGLPTNGERHWKRMRGGVLADGIASIFAAIVGCFPNTTYAQNNGVIQITGVASRHIGKFMAAVLAVLGLFPPVAHWVTAMPPCVLGGMALLLFGLVAVAGLRLIFSAGLNQRNALIVAVSLGVGLGVPTQPQWLAELPGWLRTLFESSVSAGGLTALVLNFVMPGGKPAGEA